MPSTRETVESYFQSVAERDLEGMLGHWVPGKVGQLVGMADLVIPEGYREWFGGMFAAFPDFELLPRSIVVEGDRAAVHWKATGTFDGEGSFEGFKPNGATIAVEGIDLVKIEDGKIVELVAVLNGLDMARQLGVVPPAGSIPDKALAAAINAKTTLTDKLRELRG